jgi:hypothetical protein
VSRTFRSKPNPQHATSRQSIEPIKFCLEKRIELGFRRLFYQLEDLNPSFEQTKTSSSMAPAPAPAFCCGLLVYDIFASNIDQESIPAMSLTKSVKNPPNEIGSTVTTDSLREIFAVTRVLSTSNASFGNGSTWSCYHSCPMRRCDCRQSTWSGAALAHRRLPAGCGV